MISIKKYHYFIPAVRLQQFRPLLSHGCERPQLLLLEQHCFSSWSWTLGKFGLAITIDKPITWGSEIWTILDSEWSKEVGLQMVWIWIGSEICKRNHLKSGQMDAILLKTIWNLDKMSGFRMVWFSNGGDNNYSLRYSPTLWIWSTK